MQKSKKGKSQAYTLFGNPAALMVQDPWLCVTRFPWLCPYRRL